MHIHLSVIYMMEGGTRKSQTFRETSSTNECLTVMLLTLLISCFGFFSHHMKCFPLNDFSLFLIIINFVMNLFLEIGLLDLTWTLLLASFRLCFRSWWVVPWVSSLHFDFQRIVFIWRGYNKLWKRRKGHDGSWGLPKGLASNGSYQYP